MYILENVPLSGYSTMRLGGKAAYLTDIHATDEIPKALAWAANKQIPVIMIGGGSNIIWQDDGFPGLVLVNKIMGFEEFKEDEDNIYLTVGAGEDWDSVVKRSVDMGFSGIEQLSYIPGTAGATPIQNVGAYGREISEVLTTLQAYDTQKQSLVTMPASDCAFGYRTSRFKTTDKGRFFITSITLHLTKTNPLPPYYPGLQGYFSDHNIKTITPAVMREAVIAIRKDKLPDPSLVANNGSFFANPIISDAQFRQLRDDYPTIISWPASEGRVKLSAAWLVEQAGLKDIHDQETGMATWKNHALVIINESATSTNSLISFRDKIVATVKAKFGVTLEQEPELI